MGLIVSFALLILILRIETYRFQHKAERMMEDFQSINLRHSTWPDAEGLIRRWGKYGSYQGDCTGSFCRYTIALQSPQAGLEIRLFKHLHHRFVLAPVHIFFATCQHLGVRSATLRASMVVQDNVVVRKSAVFKYDVPDAFSPGSGYSLIATSGASSRLTTLDGWPLINSEQLAEHSFYGFTRPGGCSFCMMVNVAFTRDTPDPEMRRLTTFDLGCITRLLHPCRNLEDIYPASERWHLYDGTVGGRPAPPDQAMHQDSTLRLACHVPILARGRDADQILSVTPVNEAQKRKPGEVNEKASVRLESVLKGSTRYKTGEVFSVTDRSYSPYTPLQIETPLTPGKRFLLLSMHPEYKSEPLELDRCLVVPDTAEARAQIQQGVAQNDSLRFPDPHASDFIPE
ncbi:hypothetical protein [Granulicella arctica]|uniref:hypothetical protein n=1 Tax=Granulicella arctica TaxID=940613 RepID=UPI0021DFC6A5|nr:hypothetical protein [Granulicella arctica]